MQKIEGNDFAKYLCKYHLILLSKKCLKFGDFKDGFVVFTTRKILTGIRVFTLGFRAGRVLVRVQISGFGRDG